MKKRIGTGKNYADFLTILLVIIIIAIIALIGFFTFKFIKKNNIEANASNSNDKFLEAAEENKKKIKKASDNTSSNEVDYAGMSDLLNQTGGQYGNGQANQGVKKQYLGNYEIKGSINIPKTNCNYPILEKVTVDSLNKAVAILDIVANPELNRTVRDLNVPGTNAFILGHNYLNGQFFSDNDKLAEGDIINITDQLGTVVKYTIYDMFYAQPDDASFMERDIDINTREITLQTCNDNSSQRLIILAKDN